MLQPGTLINQRYQIVRQVGQGGFGFVYEAFDTRLDKPVALKQTRFTDTQRKATFEREAKLLAQLKHARLPQVTDHFSDADGQFLVMEFIPGDDLATKLQQRGGPFPLAQVLQWADQLLEILAYLHNHQPPVCHYDIKPGNLKLAPDGSLMLLDFGLAKSSDSRASGFSDDYSPYEQFAGIGTDARSDLYAVGATLYHLLVGTPPPNALTRSAAVHHSGNPDPLCPPHTANPTIPPTVSAALVQALAIKPADRPASATVLRHALGTAPSSSAGAPTQGIPPQGSAPRQAPLHPPSAVGAPTIPVRPPPATRKAPPFVSWLGALLVVLSVSGAFLVLANRGGTPVVQPATGVPVVVAEAPTLTRTAVPPIALPPTTAPAALPAALVPEMIAVPAGSFLMGSSSADSQADDDEKPQHTLTLPAYEIGKTEVTNAQFRPFVTGDGYTNQAYWDAAGWQWRTEQNRTRPSHWNNATLNGDQQPVVGVTWYEAMAYARWLSTKTGLSFSLPTEAEWEYAARGTDGRIYPWGNTRDAKRANSSESGIGKTTPVGSYPNGASPFGALDMAGNVFEWTRSIYTAYPYNASDGRENVSDLAGKGFVIRGGSWDNVSLDLRAAYRGIGTPAYGDLLVGLRLARHEG